MNDKLRDALEAAKPFEKLFADADRMGKLSQTNFDAQIATVDLRRLAYAVSDLREALAASKLEPECDGVPSWVDARLNEGYSKPDQSEYDRGWKDGCNHGAWASKPEPQAQRERCHAGQDGDCIHKNCPQLRDNEPAASGRHCTLDVDEDDEPEPQAQAEPVLEDIEQYRLQMAGISTAAIGYWKEGDGILPEYDTLALRDVAKLYAKYAKAYEAIAKKDAALDACVEALDGWRSGTVHPAGAIAKAKEALK